MTKTNTIPVVDAGGRKLAPCHPARARRLLRRNKAFFITEGGSPTLRLLRHVPITNSSDDPSESTVPR